MINNYPENMNMDELLLNKKFSQLNENEQKFVLEMLGSEAEYEQMQNMLLCIKHSFAEEEEIIPHTKIKDSLMQAFEKKYNKNKKIIAFNQNKKFLYSPVFQMAAIAVILIGIGILLFNSGIFQKNQLAVNTVNKTTQTEENILPSVAAKQEHTDADKTNLNGNKFPATEESKTITASENKQPAVFELKKDKSTTATIDTDKLVLNKDNDKETVIHATGSRYELTEKAALQTPVKDTEKYNKESPHRALAKDALSGVTQHSLITPESNKNMPAGASVTDALSVSERKDHKKQSDEKFGARQEKKLNSISLAEKPELIEFLFTAL